MMLIRPCTHKTRPDVCFNPKPTVRGFKVIEYVLLKYSAGIDALLIEKGANAPRMELRVQPFCLTLVFAAVRQEYIVSVFGGWVAAHEDFGPGISGWYCPS